MREYCARTVMTGKLFYIALYFVLVAWWYVFKYIRKPSAPMTSLPRSFMVGDWSYKPVHKYGCSDIVLFPCAVRWPAAGMLNTTIYFYSGFFGKYPAMDVRPLLPVQLSNECIELISKKIVVRHSLRSFASKLLIYWTELNWIYWDKLAAMKSWIDQYAITQTNTHRYIKPNVHNIPMGENTLRNAECRIPTRILCGILGAEYSAICS